MSVGAISTSSVNAIKGTEFEGMSIQMMAAMVMLEVGATKKKEAEMKISDMKAQNDKVNFGYKKGPSADEPYEKRTLFILSDREPEELGYAFHEQTW